MNIYNQHDITEVANAIQDALQSLTQVSFAVVTVTTDAYVG